MPYQEVPQRAVSTAEALRMLPWVQMLPALAEDEMEVEELYAIHDPALISHLQEGSQKAAILDQDHPQEGPVYFVPWIFPVRQTMMKGLLHSPEPAGCFAFDTYAPIGKDTWQAALSSARLAWQGAGLLLNGEKLVYAICRPPGHHAGVDHMGGYCYLNNAALAASRLQKLGRGVILDIDYHHGNGTQEIFWNNPQVLTISLHADPADEYPYFSGYEDEIGGADAPGANLNLPLEKGCYNNNYLDALNAAIVRIKGFNAHWLVLSAGYDTCEADPSTHFSLTDDVYEEIGRWLGMLHLPTLVVHEGGYAVEKNGELAVKLLEGFKATASE